MKTLLKPLLAATILSLSLGNVAMAKPNYGGDKPQHCMKKGDRGHHAKGKHFSHQPRFLRGIDLTDKQKDQIFALTHAEMPKKRDMMKERKQLKQALMQLSDNYTEAKAVKIADQLAALERESVLARARHQHKIMSLLTAEQKKQVSENKEKFKQRRHFKQSKGKMSKRFNQSHRNTAI